MKTRAIIIFFIAAFLVPEIAAREPQGNLPTVDQILEKYVKAVGGREAITKLSTRVVKARQEITTMGLEADVEGYQKAPNKLLVVVTIPGHGTSSEGYDGTTGWSHDPMTGLRRKGGAELARMKREYDLYKDINLKQHYPKMVVNGRAEVAGRQAYEVEATPAEGAANKMYFDAETGLLIRQDGVLETPEVRLPVEYYFEDYREVDGVKIPFTTRLVNSSFTTVIKLKEVKHNVPVDDAKFQVPSSK
ncbi:MAG TPA: hypothetical protein VJQ56_11145 [Blastocatellia bacterium]|nr:hypothetical protein [Blastocatellia bacterium]